LQFKKKDENHVDQLPPLVITRRVNL
jgi:hypothetical protein